MTQPLVLCDVSVYSVRPLPHPLEGETVWSIQPAGACPRPGLLFYLWWRISLSITEGFLTFAGENLRKQTDAASLQKSSRFRDLGPRSNSDCHLS